MVERTEALKVRLPPAAPRPTFVPAREAVLTLAQLAAWLQVGEDAVRKMNFKAVQIGKNRWRYVAGQVLDELERRAE